MIRFIYNTARKKTVYNKYNYVELIEELMLNRINVKIAKNKVLLNKVD